MSTPLYDADLAALLSAWVDGSLDDAGQAELERSLRSSDSAAAFAAAWLDQHAALAGTRSAAKAPTVEPPAPALIPIYRKGHEPKPDPSEAKVRMRWALAAALLAACGLAIYVFVSSLPQAELPDPTSSAPLANLIENASGGTLTTPGGFISEGRDYPRGEYALDRGTAEFMLTNAVNVKLRGKTHMLMRNNMNVSLTRGSAAFVVPADARGFTVHLPDGSRVVDLGTRFTINLRDDGGYWVRVQEGRVVRLRTDEARGEIRQEIDAGASLVSSPDRTRAAFAVPIHIADPSFDHPNVGDRKIGRPHHWKTNVDAMVGIFDSQDAQFPGTTGDNANADRPTGGQVGFVEGMIENTQSELSQRLSESVTPGAEYALRLLIGRRADAHDQWGFGIRVVLETSGGQTIIDETNPLTPRPRTFEPVTLIGVAPIDATGDLVIRFIAGDGKTQAFVDDVQLERALVHGSSPQINETQSDAPPPINPQRTESTDSTPPQTGDPK